ncbi:MAG: FtsX-like permease family protein [Pikeienuella sp.]
MNSSAGPAAPAMALPIWRIAIADLAHEWPSSAVAVLSVTVALAPLLILLGLWLGVVETMRTQLTANPANLELKHLAVARLPDGFFEAAQSRPGVGFVVPRTRYVNLQVTLANRADLEASPTDVLLAPTASGDPMLGFAGVAVPSGDRIVLGARAAEALRVAPGAQVTLILSRIVEGGSARERVPLRLTVHAVLPAEIENRPRAYVPLPVLLDIQNYQEWVAVPDRGWSGGPARGDDWGGFRLYAATIDDVEPVRRWLVSLGLDVRSEAARIAFAERVDRDLGILFFAIFTLTLVGYAATIGLSQVASVARKRRVLAVLRLIGYGARAIALLPLLQGVLLAFAGALAAILVYHLAQPVIGALFRDIVPGEGSLMRLPLTHAAGALLGTVAVAGLASTVAVRQALAISPSETLREA